MFAINDAIKTNTWPRFDTLVFGETHLIKQSNTILSRIESISRDVERNERKISSLQDMVLGLVRKVTAKHRFD